MKKIYALLSILIVSTYYSQPATTDPYFIETRDTISAFGPTSITRNILEDKKGNIWFASWQGIMKYDGKVFTNYTLKKNLIHFHVYSITEDRSGNIWFGTVRGGAYKYNGKTFTLFTTNDGLADDLIGCILEDKSGNIWFGTDGGVSRCDTSVLFRTSTRPGITTLSGLPLTSKKGFTNYTTANGLCGDRVNSIIQDKTGKIWIGTRSGVSCYDGKSFTNFTIKGVPFTNVRCIKEDKNGKIWIGGQEGLYCYDPSATGEASLTKLTPNFICYFFEDKAGNFWISTGNREAVDGMALYKYDLKNFTKILVKNKDGDSQVFEITEDKNGNIWFGTMKGPCRYDGKSFMYFTK
jgi:ligand-binding sensor domain-containing protein